MLNVQTIHGYTVELKDQPYASSGHCRVVVVTIHADSFVEAEENFLRIFLHDDSPYTC